MIVSAVRQLETLSRTALLGLRLWDALRRTTVSEGLRVTIGALAKDEVRRSTVVDPNLSGIFVANGIAGLRTAEFPPDSTSLVGSPPSPREFLVLVEDPRDRYVGFCLRIELPNGPQPMAWPCEPESPLGSPVQDHSSISLFPASTYPIQSVSALAVLRAQLQLWDPPLEALAAWAMVEAWHAGRRIARAVADAEGRALMLFPYPIFPLVQQVSPPGLRGVPIQSQDWVLDMRVHYGVRDTITTKLRPVWQHSPRQHAPAVPDLCEVLRQEPALFVMSRGSTAQTLSLTLRYAEELVVASDQQSTLLIKPS